MLKSVLLTMVSFMLVIIVCFNAFGIQLEPTNFFGHMLQVEGFVGDTAGWLLNTRDNVSKFLDKWIPKVKEAFAPILDVFDSLREFFEDLDDRFAILDTLSTWMENALNAISDALNYINIFVRYCTEYGLGVFDKDWWDGLGVAWSALHEEFYETENGKIDFEIMYDIVDAFVHGEENEFSYLVYETSGTNVSSAALNKNTIVWHPDSIAYWFIEETFANAEYWAVTSDLSLPKEYANFLSRDLRHDFYFNYYWIPVSNSNMVYVSDSSNGVVYYLTGFRVKRYNNIVLEGEYHPLVINNVECAYELEFSASYQGTVYHSIWLTPADYFGSNNAYKAKVLDQRYVRDDDNGRYSQ